MNANRWSAASVAMVVFFVTNTALAGGGGGLPWETAIGQLQSSLSGPVAMVVGLAALVAAIAKALIGGDLGQMGSQLIVLIVGGAALGFSGQILSMLGLTGALVA